MKVFLKILMWVAIVAAVIFIVLWVSVLIADEFNSIPELIDYLINEYSRGKAAPPPASSTSAASALLLPRLFW